MILILATVPAWAYILWVSYQVRKSGFGYEFGSAAGPTPLSFRLASGFALFGTLIGTTFLLFDFTRWKNGLDNPKKNTPAP